MFRNAVEPLDYPFFDYRRLTFSLGIEAAERIWLSGSTAVAYDQATDAMVVSGDLVTQSRLIFEKMRCVLEARSLGLQHVTRLVLYVTPRAWPQMGHLARTLEDVFPQDLSTSIVVVERLLRETALIEVEGVASAAATTDLCYASAFGDDVVATLAASVAKATQSGFEPRRSLVLLPVSGNMRIPARIMEFDARCVIVPSAGDGSQHAQAEITAVSTASSIVLVAAEGDPTAGDIVAQCRRAYSDIAAQLMAAGSSVDQVVKTTEFITQEGLQAYRGTASVRRDVFRAPYPAATGVIVSGLPKPGCQILIEVTGIRDGAS